MKLRHLALSLITILFASCIHVGQVAPDPNGNFPPQIASILVTKCAISGCHNQASYGNADSLLLDTWAHLFQGSSNGAVVIPYSTAYSTLLYYVNTNTQLGPVYQPLMPLSSTNRPLAALTTAEYNTLSSWIKAGAPDANGNIAFASDPDTRQKEYLVHECSDKIIVVIDSKTGLAMRVIPTSYNVQIGEKGHAVKFSPDGMYAYLSLIGYNYLKKIDTRTDKVVDSLDLSRFTGGTQYQGGDMKISPDGASLVLCNYVSPGGWCILINTAQMTFRMGWPLNYPHAVTANAGFDTFFVTEQNNNDVAEISNDYSATINIADSANRIGMAPHDIIMAPDYSKFFVTCQGKDRVQVIDAHTHNVLDSINVGAYPQDMALSLVKPYLFVTCTDPANGSQGSVYVINYNTMQIVKTISGQFFAPHGIAVDDKDGLVYVASTNTGGEQHGGAIVSSVCGPTGWYNAYYISTLQPAFSGKRFNIFVTPYAMDTRFK